MTSARESTVDSQIVGPRRVLIADDEHLIATGLVSMLTELGCEVIGPASNGQAAIDLARENTPDMALLDIRMPIMDGLTAARTIWGELRIPVVILSAYSDPENVELSTNIGVFAYLLKPADRDALRVTLSVAWSRSRSSLDQTDRIVQLEKNLAQRRVVEQAKWKLVERFGITEAEAHRRLQSAARNNRSPLAEVAVRVIEDGYLLKD